MALASTSSSSIKVGSTIEDALAFESTWGDVIMSPASCVDPNPGDALLPNTLR